MHPPFDRQHSRGGGGGGGRGSHFQSQKRRRQGPRGNSGHTKNKPKKPSNPPTHAPPPPPEEVHGSGDVSGVSGFSGNHHSSGIDPSAAHIQDPRPLYPPDNAAPQGQKRPRQDNLPERVDHELRRQDDDMTPKIKRRQPQVAEAYR